MARPPSGISGDDGDNGDGGRQSLQSTATCCVSLSHVIGSYRLPSNAIERKEYACCERPALKSHRLYRLGCATLTPVCVPSPLRCLSKVIFIYIPLHSAGGRFVSFVAFVPLVIFFNRSSRCRIRLLPWTDRALYGDEDTVTGCYRKEGVVREGTERVPKSSRLFRIEVERTSSPLEDGDFS